MTEGINDISIDNENRINDMRKSKFGGNIDTSTELFKYVLLTITIVIIIYLILRVLKQIRIEGENYEQRKTHYYFNNTNGEVFDDNARLAIDHGESIANPRAVDHYRIGQVYLLNARNAERAHHHFREALNQIIDGDVNVTEAPFILGRIGDFNDLFIDYPEIKDELPLQQAAMVHFERQMQQLKNVEKKKMEFKDDDPEFTQKTILSRQNWQSDSQNVHDSTVYQLLQEQVNKVRSDNAKIQDIQVHGYEEAVGYIMAKVRNNPEKAKELQKVINVLNDNNYVGHLSGLSERDIITAIWQRAYDPENKQNSQQIKDSLCDAVLDCVENGNVVCMTGRTSKVWQALARLDKDEDVGILKTKQAVRNEIFQRSAKIVDDYIGENGSASQALKEAYNKGENTEQVKELSECIKKQITELKDEYKGLLPNDQLDLAITECITAV
jgi:hypothetical protein